MTTITTPQSKEEQQQVSELADLSLENAEEESTEASSTTSQEMQYSKTNKKNPHYQALRQEPNWFNDINLALPASDVTCEKFKFYCDRLYTQRKFKEICEMYVNSKTLAAGTTKLLLPHQLFHDTSLTKGKTVSCMLLREIWETAARALLRCSMYEEAELHLQKIEKYLCCVQLGEDVSSLTALTLLQQFDKTKKLPAHIPPSKLSKRNRLHTLLQCWEWRAQYKADKGDFKEALAYLQRILVCTASGQFSKYIEDEIAQKGKAEGITSSKSDWLLFEEFHNIYSKSSKYWKQLQKIYERIQGKDICAKLCFNKSDTYCRYQFHDKQKPASSKIIWIKLVDESSTESTTTSTEEERIVMTSLDSLHVVDDAVERVFLRRFFCTNPKLQLQQEAEVQQMLQQYAQSEKNRDKEAPRSFDASVL